jgi:hypothetical protein
MSQKKKQAPVEHQLTFAEACRRAAEFKFLKPVEGKGVGGAVPPVRNEKSSGGKAQR